MMLLFVKASVLVLIGFAVSTALRRKPASVRYLVWLLTITAAVLLPLGSLLPRAALITLPLLQVDAIAQPVSASHRFSFDWEWVWLAGCGVLLVRLGVQVIRGIRMAGSARPAGKHGDYEIRIAPGLPVPVAWGLWRKVMLLPETAPAWSAERRRVVLMHESGHLRRNDCYALLIAEIACIFYWCNPLIWFAAAQLRREQEHAADDDVLARGVAAIEYADHLIALARAGRTPSLAAGAVCQSELGVRLNAILDPGRARSMMTRRTLVPVLLAFLLISLPLATVEAQRKIHSTKDAGVLPPKLIHKVEPDYTAAARDAKIEGGVLLEVVIEADGRIEEAKVLRSLDEGLDANAIAAVKTWRFEPARKDGEPVAVSARIEVNFRLI